MAITRTALDSGVMNFDTTWSSVSITLNGSESLLVFTVDGVSNTPTVTWGGRSFSRISTGGTLNIWMLLNPPAGTSVVTVDYAGQANLGVNIVEKATGFGVGADTPLDYDNVQGPSPVSSTVVPSKDAHLVAACYSNGTPRPSVVPGTLTVVSTYDDGAQTFTTYKDSVSANTSYSWTATKASTTLLLGSSALDSAGTPAVHVSGYTCYDRNLFDIGSPEVFRMPEEAHPKIKLPPGFPDIT